MAGAFSSAFSSAFDVGAGGATFKAWLWHYARGWELSVFKNVASQKVTLLAFDASTGLPKSGDAANLTAYVSKDDGAVTALGDTSATEADATNAKGLYLFDLTQAETNADKLVFSGKSSTENVVVVPATVYTAPPNFTSQSIDANGRVDVIKINGTSQTAGDVYGAVNGRLPAALTANGNLKASFTELITTALTETATGRLKAALTTLLDVASPVFTAASVNQTGDSFARLGAAGAGLTALGDTRIAHLDADVSGRMATYTQPAGFLATTFPVGTVASSAEVTSIQNNTRCVRVVPEVIERPDSGTTTYRVELLLYDDVGNMEAPDAAPTLALVNQAGTDLSSRLDSATGTLVSTGRYRWVYTASVGDTLEQLVWAFSVVEGGATRIYGNTSVIVDTTAVDFTAADRTKLTTLAADYTTARAVKLDNLDASVAAAVNNTDQVNSKLGGFSTNIPANDVYGYLRAIMRKDATVPSELGGTYTPAADSLEALRERGDAAYGRRIAKNTALANFEFPMVLSSDHVSAATGLTVTAQRSIDGGAFANCANAVAEVGNGVYKINLAASDLNGDMITLRFTAATADQTVVTFPTEAA